MTRAGSVRGLVGVVVLLGLLACVVGAALAAPPPSITVEIQSDGSAEWTVVIPVDLPSESDRTAFDDMAANETRKAQLLDQTVGIYQAVANGSSQQVARDMSVEGESISLRRDGSTGFITVALRWEGFARVEGKTLRAGDVFEGGFPLEDDQSLTIQSPDGYELSSHNVTSGAASVGETEITWNGPATVRSSIGLQYENVAPTPTATASPTDRETGTTTAASPTTGATETTGETGRGFGIVGAGAAILGIVLLGRWRS